MKCLNCGTTMRLGEQVCRACGVRFAVACASCGTQNLMGQQFCGTCGSLLGRALNARPTIDGDDEQVRSLPAADTRFRDASPDDERKQVTVLFADIKGSLELLADRDPEDANRLLDNTLHRMMDAVHQYHGTVSQARGDGIMAIFGAPVAHEDHAVRACYAALRIQELVAAYSDETLRTDGVSIQVRVGMNSGDVVVRSLRNDIYSEYTAVGRTTHLAARMEQLAPPGTILATAETVRLVEGYIAVRPIGPIAVKGIPAPVEAFEIVGVGQARSRLQAAHARGLTPFVGRDSEMASVKEAMARVVAGHGQVVAVTGEPGVGKSRLLREFVRSQRAAVNRLVLESNAVRFGQAAPYLPVIDLLKSYFKVELRDAPNEVRQKVSEKVVARLPAMLDKLPAIFELLDALPAEHAFRSLDAAQRRRSTIQAVIELLASESRVQPVIAVFEDIQWNDSLTLGLLNELVARITDVPILLLVCYRPEYKDGWKDFPHYRRVRLEPLPQDRLARLVDAMVGNDVSLGGMKDFLIERAAGNPLFLEEIVQSFVETRVVAGHRGAYRLVRPFDTAQVPATVRSVLASRIDRLPSAEKHLLQEAAVIGSSAPLALLQSLSGLEVQELRGLLASLQTADFLYEARLYPDQEYAFKHALTHEVTYGELLKERRREIHARVVAAMETLYSGHLGDRVDQIAEHAVRGHLWPKALGYLQQAGARSADRHAYREAVTLFERALDAIAHLPEERSLLEQAIDIRFDMRNALQPLGDRERIASVLREAEALAERLGDPRRVGWVHSYLTDHYWIRGQTEEAEAAAETALRIARETGDLSLRVVTNLPLGLMYHTRGEYRRAIQCFEQNISSLEGDLLERRFGLFVLPSAFSLSFQAWSLAELGEFDAAAAIGQRAVATAEQANHPISCGYAYLGLGVMRLRRGDSPSAISAFERALSVAAFADSPVGVAYVSFHLGYALALSGRLDEGVRMLEATVALAETKGFVARHALRLAYLAETYALAGRLDEAVSIAGRAVRVAREHDERANEAYALRVHGEVAFRRGELADAQPALLAAVQLAQKLEIRPLLAHCHRALARAYQADGDEAQAVLHARAAGELVEAMGMRFSTPELEPPVRAGRADGDTTAEHEPARPRRSGHARRTG